MYVNPNEKRIVFCCFVSNHRQSENEYTSAGYQNLTYDLNDTYETMIEFERLR